MYELSGKKRLHTWYLIETSSVFALRPIAKVLQKESTVMTTHF